ncbi:MAG TPA: thioredoxin [Candidatus Omnitrophota bacterium]|nr:thioredoxin [Candidatus Omnitrophota bacterium]HPT07725.1 thioredoxin [Candidatus Omnitrophota bacterium]
MSVLHVNEENFNKEILEPNTVALVDFWAPWCGPCKMIAPFIEEIAKEYAGKVTVAKVNVDESSQIASHYGIMSIPTVIFFKNGKIMSQHVGAVSKADLKNLVEENL